MRRYIEYIPARHTCSNSKALLAGNTGDHQTTSDHIQTHPGRGTLFTRVYFPPLYTSAVCLERSLLNCNVDQTPHVNTF